MNEPNQAPIRLRGVRQNNLKNLNIDLPRGRLIVVTGLSGTGKSSLVFETLHAEGQRRYVETFSPYIRQFLEMLDRPEVDSIENIPPSIAIEQRNTIKTSRSTVGTMTELCDYFKVWFSHVAELFDPDAGDKIEDESPSLIWKKARKQRPDETVLIAFPIVKPAGLSWEEIFDNLLRQGYRRAVFDGSVQKIDALRDSAGSFSTDSKAPLYVIQDRVSLKPANRKRFLEAAETGLHFGNGELVLFGADGREGPRFSTGLRSPATGERFREAVPGLFSFNSPLGACPRCRGFGRIIEIDYRLAVPDPKLTLAEGAIKPWQGAVYGESQKDMLRFARKAGIPTDVPYEDLSREHKDLILFGEPGYGVDGRDWPEAWYGVKGFFDYLETKTYKMHVRVFLARYRSYRTCPDCDGARLQAESLCWRWKGHRLPDLYRMPVSALLDVLRKNHRPTGRRRADIAFDAMMSRLRYLDQVGLGYLTLDRTSRTLSGGEVERVNLTSCLGTSLVDTLFVLDEPSIGLHSRDIDRLIGILRRLTALGNTVVVVEHDESMIRAADHVLELGPEPGSNGGHLVFQGDRNALLASRKSLTGAYLSGRKRIEPPASRRPFKPAAGKRGARNPGDRIRFRKASKHNIHNLDFELPLGRFVCLTGVSGSGKSTLLDNIVYQGVLALRGHPAEDPAEVVRIDGAARVDDVVLVDQSPVSRTPRSNPALYAGAWDGIRELFARTEPAVAQGLTASHFSFNGGQGRCGECGGLGYERVEMQFLSDIYVPCSTCDGKRFKEEILAIDYHGKSVEEVLRMTIDEGLLFFDDQKKIRSRLQTLHDVGLGYLNLGQPLNTLSGGESQRLKLVKYLASLRSGGKARAGAAPEGSLLLIDEPTTGLHRDDIKRLIGVLQSLVENGHSVVVIEHQLDVIKSADWLLEIGPGAGSEGGRLVAQGTPEDLAATACPSRNFIAAALAENRAPHTEPLRAAEPAETYAASRTGRAEGGGAIHLSGAREHNLKNVTLDIPHRQISVVTGVSGSGKSTLAFDIVFAEGQRRFMESMSAYARQFVEQLPRPEIDALEGIPPTVAIEQRVTRGNRKSTVATVTEVAQYLRLLFARIGVQHNPANGRPVIPQSEDALLARLRKLLREPRYRRASHLYLCAPLVRGRKGHHQPVATWLADHGYELMRADGKLVSVERFRPLDRYREHDVEAVVADLAGPKNSRSAKDALTTALRLGRGACFLLHPREGIVAWLSTTRTDPLTGEAFPELDPKHFSFNSSRGWCETCRGHGFLYRDLLDEDAPEAGAFEDGALCPECAGERLNPLSRAVKLYFRDGSARSLPELLQLRAGELIDALHALALDARGERILRDILPRIEERLRFLGEVGLAYLSLDRSARTLSGGEAQRIRLAGQLGSNLCGVLYILDEPSIGLHPRDNERLLGSLRRLKDQGNTLLVVEHDEETMRAADGIIDLGPDAGIHGGEVLAHGTLEELSRNGNSLTGQYLREPPTRPLRGGYRDLPSEPRSGKRLTESDWLILKKPSLRNLKGDTLRVPLGRLVMVCGVSGAGKSTLFRDLLGPLVQYGARRNLSRIKPADYLPDGNSEKAVDFGGGPNGVKGGKLFGELLNAHRFRKVIEVDQAPIGKTPRSTPATYLGLFDIIRQVYAALPEAKVHGYQAGTFSFNTSGGRCETCKGAGRIKLEMNFLPDSYLPCEDCGGLRYGPEILDVQWNGKSIADVLAMTFEEAAAHFDFHTRIRDMCRLMVDTGLGYLTLGQSSPTLSGGEAQRMKLVTELIKGETPGSTRTRDLVRGNLYILEEPTIGLHFRDCDKLIHVLHRLVDQGHTVVVVEHNVDLLAEADYLIEIGPEGGDAGGHLLYQGPARGLLDCSASPTRPFLRDRIAPARPVAAKRSRRRRRGAS